MNGEELTDEQVEALFEIADNPPKWMKERIKAIRQEDEEKEQEQRFTAYRWQNFD